MHSFWPEMKRLDSLEVGRDAMKEIKMEHALDASFPLSTLWTLGAG